jgi:uridine kinase
MNFISYLKNVITHLLDGVKIALMILSFVKSLYNRANKLNQNDFVVVAGVLVKEQLVT